MSATNLPEGVDRFEYAVVSAALDYLMNITEEILGWGIDYAPEYQHARYVVRVTTTRGEYIGVAATLMDASTEAVDTFRSHADYDPDLDGDEPEAA